MQYLLQILISSAALLGPIATILGLIQSRGWLAGIGALFICIAIAAVVYARRQRLRVESASIEIEGISIDSINAANLRRRVNRSLAVQDVDQIVTIDGSDLDMIWRYAGYCRAGRETVMEFSVDAGSSNSFDQLDCYAYDLTRDPERNHKIQPVLIGPDGISKKIAVPFLEPLEAQDPFNIMLHCRIPDTYKPGIGYYTSTLSFGQERVRRCAVQLTFLRQRPNWVRVYECESGRSRLLKSLTPVREDRNLSEYRDSAENLKARSARIYLFQRPGLVF
jgi:hypothetical protein